MRVELELDLDLHDIQGNIVKAYGRYGYPMARYFFFRIRKSAGTREFVERVAPLITTAAQRDLPAVTTNIGFTYEGLKRLGVPDETLHGFLDAFSMGMKARRSIVGDTGPNYFTNWDPIWNGTVNADSGHGDSANRDGTIYDQHTHIFMSINGRLVPPSDPARETETFPARWKQMEDNIEEHFQKILAIADVAKVDGKVSVELMRGHRGDHGDDRYQLAIALPDGKEHFGYTDGISSTYFKGSGDDPNRVVGGGKPNGGNPATAEGWDPIETGEFLLGHKDEAFEYPKAPGPPLFARNGTYLVYRKLHQNVDSFNRYLKDIGSTFPEGREAFAAKLAGRWRNGAPLVSFPTEAEANAFATELDDLQKKSRGGESMTDQERSRYKGLKQQLRGFDYTDDVTGARCPFGSHLRRANPRSALEFGEKDAFNEPGSLSNRRRILRRGLPYGKSDSASADDGDHGIIIMLLNANISRQFEFVQQQWFNFGNDFKAANDQDPILGNHGTNKDGRGNGRMVIEGDKATGKPPFFCSAMPTLVETRGGDYYFVPSMTSLRMIGQGIVDST